MSTPTDTGKVEIDGSELKQTGVNCDESSPHRDSLPTITATEEIGAEQAMENTACELFLDGKKLSIDILPQNILRESYDPTSDENSDEEDDGVFVSENMSECSADDTNFANSRLDREHSGALGASTELNTMSLFDELQAAVTPSNLLNNLPENIGAVTNYENFEVSLNCFKDDIVKDSKAVERSKNNENEEYETDKSNQPKDNKKIVNEQSEEKCVDSIQQELKNMTSFSVSDVSDNSLGSDTNETCIKVNYRTTIQPNENKLCLPEENYQTRACAEQYIMAGNVVSIAVDAAVSIASSCAKNNDNNMQLEEPVAAKDISFPTENNNFVTHSFTSTMFTSDAVDPVSNRKNKLFDEKRSRLLEACNISTMTDNDYRHIGISTDHVTCRNASTTTDVSLRNVATLTDTISFANASVNTVLDKEDTKQFSTSLLGTRHEQNNSSLFKNADVQTIATSFEENERWVKKVTVDISEGTLALPEGVDRWRELAYNCTVNDKIVQIFRDSLACALVQCEAIQEAFNNTSKELVTENEQLRRELENCRQQAHEETDQMLTSFANQKLELLAEADKLRKEVIEVTKAAQAASIEKAENTALQKRLLECQKQLVASETTLGEINFESQSLLHRIENIRDAISYWKSKRSSLKDSLLASDYLNLLPNSVSVN